jgi:hypothetical protein
MDDIVFNKSSRKISTSALSSVKTLTHNNSREKSSLSSSLSLSRHSKKIEKTKIKENHRKIISDLYYHLNQKKKKFSYNPEKRLFENFNYNNKHDKPYAKILTESQYYEKMIISELIDEFNIDYFFSKMKDKLFDKNKIEEVINKNIFKYTKKFSFDNIKKGGTNLKPDGETLLKILHIFDAKHDFQNTPSIKTYIDEMYFKYKTTLINSNLIGIIDNLYHRYGGNYEETILQYIVLFQNDIFDNLDDDTANVMYIDVNADANKFEYFSKKNKDNKEEEDIDITDPQTVYDALINIIKNFYDFKGSPNKYGYIYDTNIATNYRGLDNTYHNIRKEVFDKISIQLFPFENAYDPHSSTNIEIPESDFDNYNNITNIIFNEKINDNEHYSAIRDITRTYFNFTTIIDDDRYYPNIKLNACTFEELKKIIDILQISSHSKEYIRNIIFNIDKLTSNDSYIHHQNGLKFYLDKEKKINIAYQKSFNSINILKTFIEKFISYKDEKSVYSDLILNASLIASNNKPELWILYILVIYLMISNKTSFSNKKSEIISILFDFKKSGDWGQSLFCSKYNDIIKEKEAYFISGDKLSAARSILNGNVKTITATDYNIVDKNITNIKDVGKIDSKKKSILTLYNGKNKFKFEDLYNLINGSIFQFYAFNDINKMNKLFNFNKDTTFNNFKIFPGLKNDIIIDNKNFNFEYFWDFMIIIIYHIRTYIDTYSVFKVISTNGFEELLFDENRLIFNYNDRIREIAKSSSSLEKIYRKFDSKEKAYKIMQFNNNIFEEKQDTNALIAYLKLISYKDDSATKFYNNDLDQKYITDIISILKEVFDTIPDYNYNGSEHFCEYLQKIYNENLFGTPSMNYAKFLKFFKKFSKLIRLCQILYIDNITKGTNDDEIMVFDTIHTTIIDKRYQPKTICKIIVDKFYNDICILYKCFQTGTESIGEDVYINALKTILLSYSSFEDRITDLDKNIIAPLNDLKSKLDELNNKIIDYNSKIYNIH